MGFVECRISVTLTFGFTVLCHFFCFEMKIFWIRFIPVADLNFIIFKNSLCVASVLWLGIQYN